MKLSCGLCNKIVIEFIALYKKGKNIFNSISILKEKNRKIKQEIKTKINTSLTT
jgi:hypothetical protein